MAVSVQQYCSFSYPGFSASESIWYGSCIDGMASGRGYGLLADGRGSSIEYLGFAQGGMASGSGGMIKKTRGQLGATYLEGEFRGGLPDGTIRV